MSVHPNGGRWRYRTSWRIRAVPGHDRLDVWLSVDTSAAAVVEAVERAAKDAGITLHRAYRVGDYAGPQR